MRHEAAERYQKWLQREVGDLKLRVRWDNRIERFVIGRLVSTFASDFIDWFYVVTDGDSGYRPIDQRTVRKIISLDTWRRDKQLTVNEFVKMVAEKGADDQEQTRAALRYRVKHEARYIKKAAQQDGIL
jgi:hypothetical protein